MVLGLIFGGAGNTNGVNPPNSVVGPAAATQLGAVTPGEYLNQAAGAKPGDQITIQATSDLGKQTISITHPPEPEPEPTQPLSYEEARAVLLLKGHSLDKIIGDDVDDPVTSVMNNRWKFCRQPGIPIERFPRPEIDPADRPYNAFAESEDEANHAQNNNEEPVGWNQYLPSGEVADPRITIDDELYNEMVPALQLRGVREPLPQEDIDRMTREGNYLPMNAFEATGANGWHSTKSFAVLKMAPYYNLAESERAEIDGEIAGDLRDMRQMLSFRLMPEHRAVQHDCEASAQAYYNMEDCMHGAFAVIAVSYKEWQALQVRASERAAGVPLHKRSYPLDLELRSNLRFAHLILHELGHAFYMIQHAEAPNSGLEPWVEDHPVAELGYETEKVFFGGCWQDAHGSESASCLMPPFITDHPFVKTGSDGTGMPRRDRVLYKRADWAYAVTDDYVRKLHLPATYARLAADPDQTLHPYHLVAKTHYSRIVSEHTLFAEGDPADIPIKNDVRIGAQMSTMIDYVEAAHQTRRQALRPHQHAVEQHARALALKLLGSRTQLYTLEFEAAQTKELADAAATRAQQAEARLEDLGRRWSARVGAAQDPAIQIEHDQLRTVLAITCERTQFEAGSLRARHGRMLAQTQQAAAQVRQEEQESEQAQAGLRALEEAVRAEVVVVKGVVRGAKERGRMVRRRWLMENEVRGGGRVFPAAPEGGKGFDPRIWEHALPRSWFED